MPWPYRIILKLSDDDTIRRRELLDAYGHFAQLSILLIPLLIQLSYGLQLILRSVSRPSAHKPTKARLSPSPVNGFVSQRSKSSTSSAIAKLKWRLGDGVGPGWGTWGQWLGSLMWTSWLLVLITKDTGDGES